MKKYDCIVIGSGVSGLTAALLLSQHGKRVALIEQFSNIAPLIRRFKRGDVWCDPGFHYTGGLEESGTLATLLRCVGVYDKIQPIPMNPDGFDILSINEEAEYKMPYGYDRLQVYLSERFPSSAKAIKLYIKKLEDIQQNTAFTNLDLEFNQFSADVYKNQSLEEFLKEVGAEESLIGLLGFHGQVLYGCHASEVPLYIHAYIMGSFYQSSSMIMNGGNAIVKAFDTQIKKSSIDLYTNSTVTGFDIDHQKNIKAVYTKEGKRFECDTCICSIHPQLLIDMLAQSPVRPAFLNRLKSIENTTSPFVLFLDSDILPAKITQTNYYKFQSNYDGAANSDHIAFMASNQDAESKGRRSLAVIKPIQDGLFDNYFGQDYFENFEQYTEIKNKFTESVQDQIHRIFPELKGHARLVDVATPVTYNRYTKTVMGSMYGAKQTVNRRALTTRSSIRGLYLAGQSIQLGLMGAVVSGFMAVGNIVDEEKLRNQIKECL